MANHSEATETDEKVKKIVDELLVSEATYQDSQEKYRNWVLEGTYDEFCKDEKNYNAPRVAGEKMSELFPEPEDVLVFDIGAGSGIMGQVLLDRGFKKLHALEPLKEFVDQAKEKAIYDKILMELIGDGAVVNAPDDTYDAVVATGAFGPGHIAGDAVMEIIRVLKPGGYFVNCMRQMYLTSVEDYRTKLVPLIEQMEAQGKWRKVTWESYPNHFMRNTGLIMVFQKC